MQWLGSRIIQCGLLVFIIFGKANANDGSNNNYNAKRYKQINVEVFYTNEHVVSDVQEYRSSQQFLVVDYNLDRPRNLEKQLESAIKVDGKDASSLSTQKEIDKAKTMLRSHIGRMKASGEFDDIWTGIIKAKKYGLEKYPAIVFNSGESVIYGVTSIKKALHIAQQSRLKNEMGSGYDHNQ